MLFIWFFPRLHWAFTFSLTGAFPLLGRHVADMKSVTNVRVCVCVCAGGKQAQLNVWMARQLAVFSKNEKREQMEEGKGSDSCRMSSVNAISNFAECAKISKWKQNVVNIDFCFSSSPSINYIYSFNVVEYSTRESRLRLVEDGPQRSPCHASQVLRNRNDNKSSAQQQPLQSSMLYKHSNIHSLYEYRPYIMCMHTLI